MKTKETSKKFRRGVTGWSVNEENGGGMVAEPETGSAQEPQQRGRLSPGACPRHGPHEDVEAEQLGHSA